MLLDFFPNFAQKRVGRVFQTMVSTASILAMLDSSGLLEGRTGWQTNRCFPRYSQTLSRSSDDQDDFSSPFPRIKIQSVFEKVKVWKTDVFADLLLISTNLPPQVMR